MVLMLSVPDWSVTVPVGDGSEKLLATASWFACCTTVILTAPQPASATIVGSAEDPLRMTYRNLLQADDLVIDQVDGLGQRLFGQAWHAHQIAGQNDEKSRARVDLNVAHRDVEIVGPTEPLGVIG